MKMKVAANFLQEIPFKIITQLTAKSACLGHESRSLLTARLDMYTFPMLKHVLRIHHVPYYRIVMRTHIISYVSSSPAPRT